MNIVNLFLLENLNLIFILDSYFSASVNLVRCEEQREPDTIFSKEGGGGGSGEGSKLFGINLRVSEIPGGETVRVFGEKKMISDPFGANYRTVEFLGIPYATPPLDRLRFQVSCPLSLFIFIIKFKSSLTRNSQIEHLVNVYAIVLFMEFWKHIRNIRDRHFMFRKRTSERMLRQRLVPKLQSIVLSLEMKTVSI
jgi:hypothetical protein